MKVSKVILVVLVTILFLSSSQVQAVPEEFDSQNSFDVWLAGHGNTLGNISGNDDLDFVFRVNCRIVEDLPVIVTTGTTIAFDHDVSLIVDGRIVATDAVFRDNTEDEEDPWGSIVLRGNGGNQGGFPNGSAEFNHCTIENGGSAGGNEDWHGMIVLTNGENSSGPILEMINDDELEQNVVTGSQSDAILIYETNVNTLLVPTILLERTIITGDGEGEGCGIHYEANIPNTGEVMTLDVTSGCEITNFGGSGIIHDLLVNDDCGFAAFIQDSEIRDNNVQGISIAGSQNHEPQLGLTVDNCIISGNGNGEEDGEGMGINVQNIDNSESTVTIYKGCQIYDNEWVGVRLHDVASQNRISDSEIYDNGHSADEGLENNNDEYPWGAGIRAQLLIDCEGNGGTLIVEGCEIYENGHEGICVSVNIHQQAPNQFNDFETIIGNLIYNNGTEVEYNVGVPDGDDPMEGANIHIFENCHLVNVLNNVIKGGASGICWDANVQAATPINGRIRNNIQVGNPGDDDNEPTVYGLYVNRHLIPEAGFLKFLTHFYNNIFMENTIAGAYFNPLIVVEFDEEQFCNNLIGENGVGLSGAMELFPFNGFWDNTAGSGLPQDPEGTVNADPIFVDQGAADYHLDWNSPMINRGLRDLPIDDRYNGAFTAPLGILDAPSGIGEEFDFIDNSRNDIGAYGGGLAKGVYLNEYIGAISAGIPEADDYGFDPYCAIDANSDDVCNANLPNNPNEDPGNRTYLERDYYRILDDVSTPLNEELDIGNPNEETGQAYFEFAEDTRWWVSGVIRANGHDGLDDEEPPNPLEEDRNIIFTRLDPNLSWEEFCISGPKDDCKLYGCVFDGAEIDLYLYGSYGTGDPEEIEVYNCAFRNATDRGLYVTNRVKLNCQQSLIENCQGCGVRFSYNSQPLDGNRSSLDGVTIRDNCLDSYNYDAGVDCYQSNVKINDCFIYHNRDYGIFASSGGNPYIIGHPLVDKANNILNNGDIENQTNTFGAEIRISSSSAMDEDPEISGNNIYDIRDDGGYARQGKIISRTSSTSDIEVDNNYFGDLVEDIDDPFDPDDDFYEYGGVDLDLIGWLDNEGPLDIDKWDETTDSYRRPENKFEEGLFAMRAGELADACSAFRDFIERSPEAPKAPAAARILFRVEKTLDVDLDRLRREYLAMAESAEENYPNLAWAAKRMAVRCLIEQGQFERAISEYQDIRNQAPDEIEELFVDIDIMLTEELADGPETDAVHSNSEKIDEAFAKIEEIEAKQAGDRNDPTTPCKFDLTAAYPNPFNGEIRIGFSLSRESQISLIVYDVNGRQVGQIAKGSFNSGQHQLVWNASLMPAGSYFLNLEIDGHSVTRKIAVIK